MNLCFFDIKNLLLRPNMDEQDLIKALKLISQNFTGKRERIGEYIEDEDLVSAYSSFYLPTNIPKFDFVFNQLPLAVKELISTIDFYDIGSGPGTYSLAYLSTTASKSRVIAIDKSDLMLKQAKRFGDNFFPDADIAYTSHIIKSEKKKTFFFGNSINEMGEGHTLDLIKKHSPEVVFLIEPGTKDVFKQINTLRTKLIKEGYDVMYPCAGSSICPVEKKWSEKKDDWCHQILRMTHEHSVERLGQLSSLDRKAMPLIGHVYVKRDALEIKKPGKSAQLFRFLNETKFSYEWEVCLKNGDELELVKVEVLKKSLPKKVLKQLKKLSVGVDLELEIQKELGEKHYRITLSKISDIEF